jgi:hypothetical protein
LMLVSASSMLVGATVGAIGILVGAADERVECAPTPVARPHQPETAFASTSI